MEDVKVAAVILAAGKGTRLKSDLPKVLHEVCGRPMLAYVFDACRQAGVQDCIAVVGHGKDLVIDAFRAEADNLTWVEQSPQLGTGHAVMVCREHLPRYDHILVLCGDGPLIRPETIQTVLERHRADDNAVTLATAVLPEPAGYGRIWRDADGKLLGIVEHADCTPEQREIHEVNPSYYCFRTADLLPVLDRLTPDNAKREYYITDALSELIKDGKNAGAVTSVEPEDIYSINSRRDLARVNDALRMRILNRLMDNGVTIVDPTNTWIDARATIGTDTVIEPFVAISGPVTIGRECRIGPLVSLVGDQRIADGQYVRHSAGGAA